MNVTRVMAEPAPRGVLVSVARLALCSAAMNIPVAMPTDSAGYLCVCNEFRDLDVSYPFGYRRAAASPVPYLAPILRQAVHLLHDGNQEGSVLQILRKQALVNPPPPQRESLELTGLDTPSS